jgi:hypothetical protein
LFLKHKLFLKHLWQANEKTLTSLKIVKDEFTKYQIGIDQTVVGDGGTFPFRESEENFDLCC